MQETCLCPTASSEHLVLL